MKLLRVHIISAETCGGLFDEFDHWFRSPEIDNYSKFDPLCLVGPNGAGKSQFLQALTEIFQTTFHYIVPSEERTDSNSSIQFEIEYLIRSNPQKDPVHVRISRFGKNKSTSNLRIQIKEDDNWKDCDPTSKETEELLPRKVIGYTSGENETLSLPFLISRAGYAKDVSESALYSFGKKDVVETRLMLIDYETNLEVVVSNLLMCEENQLEPLLNDAELKDIYSFRCVIQRSHPAVRNKSGGVKITEKLEEYIEYLKHCATCYSFDAKDNKYIFDFWVNNQTKKAFRNFWKNTLDLYTTFHKLSMLNDLAISKKTRERFNKETKERRFASRLPEPQDEEKIFRFDQVRFTSKFKEKDVDYVSLSDGEHQLVQILGIFSMLSSPNILFILDEPESHLNPLWRVKFVSRLLNLPTNNGSRELNKESQVGEQECLLTTHAPFVPSDMSRENVLIFAKKEGKVNVSNPEIETYGTTFDSILDECFNVRPPISDLSNQEILALMKSEDSTELSNGMKRLGFSVEKVFLSDRLQTLKKQGK